MADLLEGLSVTLKGRSGQGGRLYGSITNIAIAEALTNAVGHDIDRRIITLTAPIRDLGTFQVPVRLHQDLIPTVTVVVEDAAGRYFAAVAEAEDAEDTAVDADEDAEAAEDAAEADEDAAE